MAYDGKIYNQNLIPSHRRTILRWSTGRRQRKVPTVRLGGKKPRRAFFVVRLFRRVRLRWLKLQYSSVLKKLKSYYQSVVKDLIDAGATLESVQQRIMMETYFTLPVMGLSVASLPSSTVGSNQPPRLMKNY